MRPLNHAKPLMPTGAYKTYSIQSPADVLVKTACEQAGCWAWLHGWQSTFDETTDLGKAQAHYVRTQSGRTFKEQRTDAGLTVFSFESRQRCFAEHKTRPESYKVWRGDWRVSPDGLPPPGAYAHKRAADWTEDFANHQQNLADRMNQG